MGSPAQGLSQCGGIAFPAVLKLNGAVQPAPHRGFGTFESLPTSIIDQQVDLVRDILLSANWTMESPVQAQVVLSGFLGTWGYTGFLSNVCQIRAPKLGFGAAFVYYDPRNVAPSGFIDGLPIWPVSIGASNALSQQSLVNSINGSTILQASILDANSILITAKPAGTLGDGIQVEGQGSISTGGTTSGGGWVLKSRASYSPLTNQGNTAQITLTVQTSTLAVRNAPMIITAKIGGVPIQMPMQQSANWYLMADDYQCCFISTAGAHGGDIYEFNNYLWACVPYIPSNVSLNFAGFVMQPANGGFITPSIGAAGGMTIDCWVGGTHVTTGPGQTGWSIVCLHSEHAANPIVDRLGEQVMQPAYVMMPVSYTPSQSRVIGIIPDAFVVSQTYGLLVQQSQATDNYRAIAEQSGPPGTLFLMTAEVNNIATPAGATSGNPPKANPQLAAGVADVMEILLPPPPNTGFLTQAPVVDSDGNVTWPFDLAWMARPININGSNYTVTNVVAGTLAPGQTTVAGTGAVLWFTPAPPGTAFGVPWSLQTN